MVTGQNEFLWERFSVSRETVLGQGQYYRLITAMFFHGSIMHLAANSIYLFYFGSRAELLLGKVRYVILYLISGICGGLCSIFWGIMPPLAHLVPSSDFWAPCSSSHGRKVPVIQA